MHVKKPSISVLHRNLFLLLGWRPLTLADGDIAAVHVLLTIPGYSARPVIAKALNLTKMRVDKTLEFLVTHKMAAKTTKGFVALEARFHIEKDSPFVIGYHTNCRQKSIQRMETSSHTDLFYSSIVSLSTRDRMLIRDSLLSSIKEIKSRIKASAPEELCCFSVDLPGLT